MCLSWIWMRIEQATLIKVMMPQPAERSKTKKYKQYYWRCLNEISKWDLEDFVVELGCVSWSVSVFFFGGHLLMLYFIISFFVLFFFFCIDLDGILQLGCLRIFLFSFPHSLLSTFVVYDYSTLSIRFDFLWQTAFTGLLQLVLSCMNFFWNHDFSSFIVSMALKPQPPPSPSRCRWCSWHTPPPQPRLPTLVDSPPHPPLLSPWIQLIPPSASSSSNGLDDLQPHVYLSLCPQSLQM